MVASWLSGSVVYGGFSQTPWVRVPQLPFFPLFSFLSQQAGFQLNVRVCTSVSISHSTSSVVTTCPDYCTTVNKSHNASSVSMLPTDHHTLTRLTSEVSSVLAAPEVINSRYTISIEERTAHSPPDTNINHMDPLPSFVLAHIPNFKWGELDGK